MNKFFEKITKVGITVIVAFAIFSFSTPVFAELQYTPLAPLPGATVGNCDIDSTGNLIDPNNCKTPVSSYIPAVFRLSIAIAGILAVLMMVVGGVQYLSTDAISGKEEGKERIQNALWGFLLAIGAFIILNTINPGLLSLDLSDYQNIRQAPSATAPSTDVSPTGAIVTCTSGNTIPGRTWCNDSAERALLARGLNSVSINKSNCLDIGQSNCTSVFGLYITAINRVKSLKTKCDGFASVNNKPACGVVVTGGTEYWLHGNKNLVMDQNPTAHKLNGTVVDLSISDPSLNSYIKQNGPVSAAGCAPGTKYIVDGATYVDENVPGNPPHWHVCY